MRFINYKIYITLYLILPLRLSYSLSLSLSLSLLLSLFLSLSLSPYLSFSLSLSLSLSLYFYLSLSLFLFFISDKPPTVCDEFGSTSGDLPSQDGSYNTCFVQAALDFRSFQIIIQYPFSFIHSKILSGTTPLYLKSDMI